MSEQIESLLEDYGEEERQRGSSEYTIYNAVRLLNRFFEYLEEHGLTLEALRIKEAQGFQSWLIEQGRVDGGKYSKGAVRNFMEIASSFYRFLGRRKLVYDNPFSYVRKIRVDKKIPKNVLREKELGEVMEELSGYNEKGNLFDCKRKYRAHVVSELQYSTGMRIKEAALLKEEDIDWQRGIVRIREGKGGKSRIGFLTEYAREVLRLYVVQMRELLFDEGFKRRETLFGVCKERLLITVNEELREVGQKLGYGGLSSHMFRHAYGFHLLRAGCDIRYIQALLGHSRLRSTEVYTKVEKEDLKRVLDTFHPRQWKGERHEKA